MGKRNNEMSGPTVVKVTPTGTEVKHRAEGPRCKETVQGHRASHSLKVGRKLGSRWLQRPRRPGLFQNLPLT